MPKISVIMSTYNRESFLPRSIESICKQTHTDFEFILVNNGSTDNSDIVCKMYAEKDSRIQVVNIEKNLGASNGKNKGIDLAIGEYITIVDDDDYCEPEMLEFLWNLANKHNADISICGSWTEYKDRLEPKYIFEDLIILDTEKGLDELLKREKYNVAPPTKLFRRQLFDKIRFKNNVLVDDIHIIYKVFANANIVVAQGNPLYYFVKHDNNMTNFIQSNKLTADLLNEYLSMYRMRTQYLSERIPAITERSRYSEFSYMVSMCNKIEEYEIIGCEEQYNYMIKSLTDNYEEFSNSPFISKEEKEELEEILLKTKG